METINVEGQAVRPAQTGQQRMKFSQDQIKKYLPHRDPFLFIDAVTAVNIVSNTDLSQAHYLNFNGKEIIGSTAKSTFEVREELTILEGHFPGNPILPGVVQVEMIGQNSSFLYMDIFQHYLDEMKVEMALLGVDSARFKKKILPGMKLEIVSTLEKVRGMFHTYTGHIYSEGELMSSASLLASITLSAKQEQ